MITLLLALALSGSCERKEGTAQCVTVERVHCKAACYTKDRDDGGYRPHTIVADGPSQEACEKELNRQAANGCKK